MIIESTATRLNKLMRERNLKQIDILRMAQPYSKRFGVKVTKSDLSQFVSGKVTPGQHKLFILCLALDVSEPWLMGYDVPMERTTTIPLTDTYRVVAKNGIPGTHVVTSDPNITDKLAELIEVTKDLTPEQIDKLIKMAEII